MKKEEEKKLNKIIKNIKDNDKLIKNITNKFYVREAKEFGTSSHIIIPIKNKHDKFLIIKISEEQFKELNKKK
jgi:hypothetical protein